VEQKRRCGLLLAILLLAITLPLATPAPTAAACGGFGRVTGVWPNRSGTAEPYWISVHLGRGGWTAFASARSFKIGQRVWVWGCITLPSYVERPWVW